MIRHDREGVEREFALVAVAKESGDHELGGLGSLEETEPLMGGYRDGVCAQLLSLGSHGREHTPGAEAPLVLWSTGVPSLKAWPT
jgi:hypothetical protein